MFEDQAFASVLHHDVEPPPDVVRRLAFVLGDELHTAFDFFDIRLEVAFSECHRAASEALSVEIEEIEYLDLNDILL